MTDRIVELQEYATALEKEIKDRTANSERDVALANAQVERLLIRLNSMDDEVERLTAEIARLRAQLEDRVYE